MSNLRQSKFLDAAVMGPIMGSMCRLAKAGIGIRRPARILMLVGDEHDAVPYKRGLSAWGRAVEYCCVTSPAGLEIELDNFVPDLVLLDHTLPGLDGASTLQLTRKKHPEIPAIVLADPLGDEAAAALLNAGAADYVFKDRPARLASAVWRLLDQMHERLEHAASERELESKLILLKTQEESSPEGILVVNEFAKVISQNQRFLDMWRIPEQLRGNIKDAGLLEFLTESVKNPEGFLARIVYLYAHPRETSREEIELRDGRIFDRYTTSMFDSQRIYLGRVWFFRDITEQRVAERQLKLFRTMVDKSNDAVEVVDSETLEILDVNERGCTDLGYAREELLGMRVTDIDAGLTPESIRLIREQLRTSGKAIFESQHLRRDGSVFPVEVSVSHHPTERQYHVAMVRDITERKRAQRALEESEIRFRTMIKDASDVMAVLERDGTIRYTSPATLEMSGYHPAELLGRRFFEFIHPGDTDKAAQKFASLLEDPSRIQRITARIQRKDGTWRTAEAAFRNRLGVPPIDGFVATIRDITERGRLIRALAAISATNSALVRASDESTFMKEICRILVEIGGYPAAWIGFPEKDEQKSISVIALAGEGGAYLKIAQITWADADQGRGPTGTAVRTGQVQVRHDYAGDISITEQREEAIERRFMACMAIPLIGQAGTIGVLTLYSSDAAAFDDEEVKLLEQLSADVSYGIEAMRDRGQHAMDLERLQQTMEATILALAATVEKRDPYTAGHQRRVAQLCNAIAAELNLNPEQIQGLELAAMIHDIGKIEIPSEILSMPRRLSEIEYSMVKLHSQAGYEILKNIDFPWPIARIVQQHHEKLDGSGYPGGLKGDQILLESRILSVADVVEALFSHRPYRPGFGLDTALNEVINGRDTKYDSAVVDACVRLFREKGFIFK